MEMGIYLEQYGIFLPLGGLFPDYYTEQNSI